MEISKVACIGAGLIGHSWATLFAAEGLEVKIQDLTDGLVAKALQQIENNLNFLEQNGLLEEGEGKKAFERIEATTNLFDAVKDVDYVQESIVEDYETKKKIFKEMDAIVSEHTILASSTSALLMTHIQKETNKPQRCIVAHPCLPPHLLPLVEIVPGEKTSRETSEVATEFMSKIGKIPVVLKREVPGHIVNRMNAALWREAIDLVDKGVATAEEVDKAFYAALGPRFAIMGPHLRAHLAGGNGGIEHFIEAYGQSYTYRWKDMANWTTISNSATKKVVQGIKEMEIVRTKTFEEICRWRDKKLMKLLKLLSE